MNKKLPLIGFLFTIASPVFLYLYYLLLNCDYYQKEIENNNFIYKFDSFLSTSDWFLALIIFVFPLCGLIVSIIARCQKDNSKGQKIFSFLSILLAIFIIVITFLVIASSVSALVKGPYSRIQIGFSGISSMVKGHSINEQNFIDANSCDQTGSLFQTTDIHNELQSLEKSQGHKPNCFSSGQNWAISIEAARHGGKLCHLTEIWCTDSTGFRGPVKAHITGANCQ